MTSAEIYMYSNGFGGVVAPYPRRGLAGRISTLMKGPWLGIVLRGLKGSRPWLRRRCGPKVSCTKDRGSPFC